MLQHSVYINLLMTHHPSYPQRILIEVWRLSLNHLYSHDAQGPDVYFRSISLASYDLWGHPVWSADHGAALTLFGGDLGAEAKISCQTTHTHQSEAGTDDILMIEY